MDLRLGTAMAHRPQQLGIDSRQPCQCPRIVAISFRLLLVINSTFCACATISSCPNSVNSRLTHGECVPVSRAMRLRAIFPNVCFIASGVVGYFLFQKDFACFIQNTIERPAIS